MFFQIPISMSGVAVPNLQFGTIQAALLTGPTTITNPINAELGSSWTLIIQQDSVGGHPFTLDTMYFGDLSGLDQSPNRQSQINWVIDNLGYCTINSIITFTAEAPISPPNGPAPILVSDLIYTALRIAGVMPNPGTGYAPEEGVDGFNALNSLVDDWGTQRLMTYTINRLVFPFVDGQQTYQIGPGAPDWNVPRPPRIETASVLILNSPTLPLEQPIPSLTYENWQQIPVKNIQSSIPQGFYYDQQYPIGNVNFYPIPTGPLNSAVIYVWQTIQQFLSLSQPVILPPAYRRALEYNLALELADRFAWRAKLSPRSIQVAERALRDIKNLNNPVEDMRCDAAVIDTRSGIYNYLSDGWLMR